MSVSFSFFCPECGTPNSYVNGNKPKFCGECGASFNKSHSISSRSPKKDLRESKLRRSSRFIEDDDEDYDDEEEYFSEESYGSREDFIKSIKMQIPTLDKKTIGDLANQEKTGMSRPKGKWMSSDASDNDVKAAIKKECTTTNRVEL